jgi:nuclear pore complex protein Nup205
MSETNSLEALQGLHRDLRALTDSKLPVLQRLVEELEARLNEFSALLDKPGKNDRSRKDLNSGKIKIDEEEYAINDEFKQQTIEIAEFLDLDELQSAALFLAAQKEAPELDRTQSMTAIIRFHRRREFLLSCLRLIMKIACDSPDVESDIEGRDIFRRAVGFIVGVQGTNYAGAFKYWEKCLSSMAEIEKWLHQIAEQMQRYAVVGQAMPPELAETMNFQKQSLTRQHEYLSAICTYMVKPGYVDLHNFKSLLAKAKSLDKHDIVTMHYVPMIASLAAWAALETNTDTKSATELHVSIMSSRENDNWALRSFHAATLVWWLAEYSGRYIEPNTNDPHLQGVDLGKEATERSNAFGQALNDGAFHFMLSISQDIRPTRWYDPAKTGMISYLLQDSGIVTLESMQSEDFFQSLVMEQFQSFVEAFITNMPDTLRKLKVEEDEQRKRLHAHLQQSAGEQVLHLERFLVIISYAYDGFPGAAEEFWNDRDGNLYGFLQWAAKRQPTPRIATFCEMLRSLSTGETNSEYAHTFLMEEGASASGKIRRTSSLSYTHIFNELVEFVNNIKEPKKPIQNGLYPPSQNPADQIVEPESAMMLESYLRLLAHLARESPIARKWLLEGQQFNAVLVYLGLCVDKVESRLRASAFDALTALLTNKDALLAAAMWDAIDNWTVQGFNTTAKQANIANTTLRQNVWEALAANYDESVAFTGLVHALVEPYPNDPGLHDTLPFPENLGSTQRMPGIDGYVDFVLGHVFARKCLEIQDAVQLHVMRWNCLGFMVSCLSTFNEDLVVFANKSNIPVDSVIDSSSLAAYVKLHPFARVMEWLFNDNVLKALFAASHHGVDEVDNAASDSPLVSSLMLSIEVMDLIMKLQATYLNIIRPVMKTQSSVQRTPVSNTALASFEDAILNNLQLIVDLGLYCGTGHEGLTLASLRLLEKLASSRKLVMSPAGFGQRSGRSKIVGILEKDKESERISRSLVNIMQLDDKEIEVGPEAPGYIVKLQVLDFLNSCLTSVSNRPTIAHVLLGFSCESTTVRITEDSLWANGQSLFHSILTLAVYYPDSNEETFLSWMSALRKRSWDILQKLWRSPLTSSPVMAELRINELLFFQSSKLPLVDGNTPWDGMSLLQGIEEQEVRYGLSDFFCGGPAFALQNFLQQRAMFFDYEARELRATVRESMPTLRSRIQSVLLGVTVFPGEENIQNPNIFDLFDFVELHIPENPLPECWLTEGINMDMCKEEKDGMQLYELSLVEQVFVLRVKEKRKSGGFKDEQEEAVAHQLVAELLVRFADQNRRAELEHYQKELLKAWVQLVVVALESCDFDVAACTSFVLQTLQIILPKLEMSYNGDIFTALQLSSLAAALIQKIDFSSSAFEKTMTGDFANDRLSQLFRAALVGIYSPVTTTELREFSYQTCFRYINGTFEKATHGSALGRHTLNTVKNCGNHLLEVICDDAYSGQGSCRITALLLLDAFVAMAIRQESKHILEGFVGLNFVGVLVDNIKQIPEEIQAAPSQQVTSLLSYYDASLSLLGRICQTRVGAAHVLNAGLFQAIRDSRIFAVDPDIGLDIDNPEALKKYFELMLSVLRVISSAVISRGQKNEQTVYQAREFLKENRHSMVSIFKRSVNLGGVKDIGVDLGELVDCFTLLVEITGFLKYEDEHALKAARPNFFS